jgi:hypothetical protein
VRARQLKVSGILFAKATLAIAMIASVFPVLADAAPLGCKKLNGLRSKNSDTPSTIRFLNARDRMIRTYWLDFGGVQRFYAEIEPGGFYVQPTYLTHPWIILDEAGNCNGPYMPRQGGREIVVR